MRPPERVPSLTEAVALGLLQGPSELLPVSSSAHMSLIPWLAGWRYGELDGDERKSFEIAVHAGAGLALALALREELKQAARDLTGPALVAWAPALIVPAGLGLLLRGPIERRLSGEGAIVTGLAIGSLAMAWADLRESPSGRRSGDDFGAFDGLALGLAQALALAPGISRSGATLGAARARGYGRREAQALSWRAGLPVILGMSALECARLLRDPPRGRAGTLAVGAAAAFLSTRTAAGPLGARALRGRRLAPYSVYRCMLGAAVVVRLRRAQ